MNYYLVSFQQGCSAKVASFLGSKMGIIAGSALAFGAFQVTKQPFLQLKEYPSYSFNKPFFPKFIFWNMFANFIFGTNYLQYSCMLRFVMINFQDEKTGNNYFFPNLQHCLFSSYIN